MEIVLIDINGYVEIKLKGRLDTIESENLSQTINNVISRGNENIIINFAELNYINSSGLRIFLDAAKKLDKKGKKLNLCEMRSYIKEVFDIAGFSSIFNFYKTREEIK